MNSQLLKNRFGPMLMLIGCLNATTSPGGIVSINHNLGQCDNYRNNALYIVHREAPSISISDNGDGTIIHNKTTAYKVWAWWQDPSQYSPITCSEFVQIRYKNDLTGPEILRTMREINMFEIKRIIRERIRNMPRPRTELDDGDWHWHIRTPAAVCGVRGSLDGQTQGLDLLEASPDGLVFQEELTASDVQAGRYVYFEVERKGDEDWLELKVNNEVFYKRQLVNFETNKIYEVEVPSTALSIGQNTWSYFLNSTGAPNSSIFFPMENRESSEPWCGKVVTANNAVQLEFTNLVIGFDYVVEQSFNLGTTWLGVNNFTASNDVMNVTFPITNSAMFYRIALPVP